MGFFVPALRLVCGNIPEDVRCSGQELLADAILQLAGNVENVFALVAVGGKAEGLAAQFQVPEPNASSQDVHLPSGIIDIVLALDRIADSFQQVCRAGTVGRAPAMANMQRAGGVGGHEFDLITLLVARAAT